MKSNILLLINEWLINENVRGDNIEPIEEVIYRIEKFIAKCLGYNNQKVLSAVTHSGFLYALYKYMTDSPLHLKPTECSVSFPKLLRGRPTNIGPFYIIVN